MDSPELASIIVAGVSLVASVLVARQQRHTAKAANEVQAAATAINGFQVLVKEQRNEILRLTERIDAVRARMREMEEQHMRDREQWKAERSQLEARIRELEAEREKREQRLRDLLAERSED